MLNLVLADPAVVDRAAFREGIVQLQDEWRELEQVDCPLKHHFAPGVYAREILLPAGSMVIGKIHKHAHLNIISRGRGFVATEFGREYFNAPHTFVSEPGTKRAVHAITDVIWTTIHPTDETDLVKIEQYVISPTYDALAAEKPPEQIT